MVLVGKEMGFERWGSSLSNTWSFLLVVVFSLGLRSPLSVHGNETESCCCCGGMMLALAIYNNVNEKYILEI